MTWTYKFVNHYTFCKEIVEITFSNIDRFLHTNEGNLIFHDERMYQLAVISSLAISIKILDSTRDLDLNNILVYLSNGLFKVQDIISMEKKILSSLSWQIIPSTSYSFIYLFIDLLQRKYNNSITMNEQFKQDALLQAEIAVSEINFVGIRPSAIATASLLNSIQSNDLFTRAQHMFLELFYYCDDDFDSLNETLYHVRIKLVGLLRNHYDPKEQEQIHQRIYHYNDNNTTIDQQQQQKQTKNEDERITTVLCD